MQVEYVEQIINILKDCDCPLCETDKKLWDLQIKKSIAYLECELTEIKIKNRRRYIKSKRHLS